MDAPGLTVGDHWVVRSPGPDQQAGSRTTTVAAVETLAASGVTCATCRLDCEQPWSEGTGRGSRWLRQGDLAEVQSATVSAKRLPVERGGNHGRRAARAGPALRVPRRGWKEGAAVWGSGAR